ncbi:MAG: hypothetical protein QOH47_771 [Sphingomonadales bacterium]|jgi:Ca2+-binding RTX toxin-like protein|nr:hypothetical protein [Sphingomonadales bacterium]
MAHLARRGAAPANRIVGTEGDDYILVTAPTEVDGLGGFDRVAFDFQLSPVAIHLDLSGLWSGGVGILNGYQIRNIETIGSPYYPSELENSWILGSAHDDVLIAGADYPLRVILIGDEGDDLLVGGAGDPTIENANNYLNGGSGDDVVIGGSRGDDLDGEEGDDRLYGLGGADMLFGGGGRDLLRGGDGNDYLRGDADNDQMFGDAGDDRFEASFGSDRVDGGAGSDIVEYWGAEGGVTVNLQSGVARESAGGFIDHLVSIENAAGSFFADVLRGSNAANLLFGDRGDDALYGRGGDDRLSGGSGDDRLEGGAGADLFVVGEADADAGTEIGSDFIADFDRAEGDLIDLSAIDADSGTYYENEAFVYVGAAAFSGVAGELRVTALAGGWEVTGDRDGDAIADFSILVASPAPLGASDFIL